MDATRDDVKTVIADPTVFVNAVGIRDEIYRILSVTAGVLVFGQIRSRSSGLRYPSWM
jgi:hypothetical protein